jgi:adenylate kinase
MAETATYIVLVGVQGSGKGTQAKVLVDQLKIPHVSTGDLFREMKTLDTPLAREIQALMKDGKLISDEITIQVVRERLTKGDAIGGVILDGFPRTKPQAEALDSLLTEFKSKLTSVLHFKLAKELAVERIVNRRVCSLDKSHDYNLKTKPPQVEGHCDFDNAPLIQRPDDTPEAAEVRINTYLAETAPLLDYYRQRGILCEIEANQPVDGVTADLMKCLER